jgi:hypothetical protein
MASDRRPGIKRILFGIFLLFLSAFIAISEYNELHSGSWFKTLLEPEIWTVAAILGVLGIAVIGSRLRAGRKSRRG